MYPRILLARPFRRAIMSGMIVIFLITTPSLLMYAAGYRYDWDTKTLKQTGVLSINAEPADADVFVNNILIKKRLPIWLSNLAPGIYSVRIEKPGFKKWQKEISIDSKQTTYIKDITLFRERLPVRALPAEQNINEMFPSADGRYVLLRSRQGTVETIELLDAETNTLTPIVRESRQENAAIAWSNAGSAVMLIRQDGDISAVNLLSAANPERTATFSYNSADLHKRIIWNEEGLSIAYIKVGDEIRRLSFSGERTLAENVPKQSIWFVDESDRLWFSADGNRALSRDDGETIPLPADFPLTDASILDINRNRVIIQTPTAATVINRTNGAAQILPASLTFPHRGQNSEWISWSPWEIWGIYENGRVEALNRLSERLVSVATLEETGTLLLATEQGLFAFNPGYFVTQELFSGEIESAAVNRKSRVIYFLGSVGDKRGLYILEY